MRLDAGPWFKQAYRRIRPANETPTSLLGRPVSDKELSRQLGMSRYSLIRAREEGLTICSADEWAVAIGLHPAEIWGDDFYRTERPDTDQLELVLT